MVRDRPYVGACPFCGNGILRYWTCKNCSSLLVICNECDLIWKDAAAAAEHREADGTFPDCPNCPATLADGHESSDEEIAANGLDETIAGYYDGE